MASRLAMCGDNITHPPLGMDSLHFDSTGVDITGVAHSMVLFSEDIIHGYDVPWRASQPGIYHLEVLKVGKVVLITTSSFFF